MKYSRDGNAFESVKLKTKDRVRHRDSGWTGTVVKTHNSRGELLRSGGHQDVVVRWDRNGRESRVTLAAANGDKASCATCKLCNGSKGRADARASIAIYAHGAGATHFTQATNGGF